MIYLNNKDLIIFLVLAVISITSIALACTDGVVKELRIFYYVFVFSLSFTLVFYYGIMKGRQSKIPDYNKLLSRFRNK